MTSPFRECRDPYLSGLRHTHGSSKGCHGQLAETWMVIENLLFVVCLNLDLGRLRDHDKRPDIRRRDITGHADLLSLVRSLEPLAVCAYPEQTSQS